MASDGQANIDQVSLATVCNEWYSVAFEVQGSGTPLPQWPRRSVLVARLVEVEHSIP